MSTYATRAIAIEGLTVDLRRRLEITSVMTTSDKMSAINIGVEVVNKILHCFAVSQELLDNIERLLNQHYRRLQPNPTSVDRVFYALLSVVRKIEDQARAWVARYKK